MTFQELLGEVQKIPAQETRAKKENYLEVVFERDHWEAVKAVLQSYFGVPLKPEGEPVSEIAKKYAEPYGGVHQNQTLYYLKNGKTSAVALLWPWGNETSLTAKIIQG